MAAALPATWPALLSPGRPAKHRAVAAAVSSRDSSSSSLAGIDLYELLGVESDASPGDIKKAYRWLQKRCHPDVAAANGHDMSILLNQAYAVLSDPASRSSYNGVRAEWVHYGEYTGEPLYSRWCGPGYEKRAVFVDEAKCVGCLKCALVAKNTFAIERRYGRARAVSQWGDPEHVIEDAIRACPVDCISWVDRSSIPALEYVMSKQPRSTVSVGVDNNVARQRSVDVFQAAEFFLKKRKQFEEQSEQGSQTQRDSQMAAAGAIHSQAGQWWSYLVGKRNMYPAGTSEAARSGSIVLVGKNSSSSSTGFSDSRLRALYETATRRRLGVLPGAKPRVQVVDDYWVPLEPTPPEEAEGTAEEQQQHRGRIRKQSMRRRTSSSSASSSSSRNRSSRSSSGGEVLRSLPLLVSPIAGCFLALSSEGRRVSVLQQHYAGAAAETGPLRMVMDRVNGSVTMHIVLGAVAWYLLTSMLCSIFELMISATPVQDDDDDDE